MSENKIINKFNKIVSAQNFLVITCAIIFCLSIFLRSIIDIGPDTGVYLDLGKEVAKGHRYYYDFFESNFPLSFYIYALQYKISLGLKINPIITAEIFINFLALLSIFYSAKILQRSAIYNNRAHYNLIIISYFLGFFLRSNVIQLGEFGTKSSFLLLCLFPYISFSFERKIALTKSELIQRGILMGLIPCFKPHYLIFPLFIEAYRFWQKKSLKFFCELDKLVMLLIGAGYLFFMLKQTPEFFEFIVPMWPKIYKAYDDSSLFFENILHRLGGQTAIFCFIFLAFSRLKFSPNDRILLLIFCAVSVLIILENIGTIDQLGVFYAVTTTCFLKIFYDLIMSEKFSFRENKSIILVLIFWPIFDMEVLPTSILSLSGFINVWWLIALVYPFLFCLALRKKNRQEFLFFKTKYLTTQKIIAAILLYLLLLFLALISLKYLGGWGFIAFNLFALFAVLFCFEKIYSHFEKNFSAFFVFLVTTSTSCLIYSYIAPLSNLIPTKHYDTFPNKLSDEIAYYSRLYAPNPQDGFLVFSDLIVHQFPILNYLDKENYHTNHVVTLMAQRGFLGNSTAFPQNKDRETIFTLSYIFEDLKKQLRNKNVKILFINNGNKPFEIKDRCLIGFLEYYFSDPEFKKIFFENFRFENRILTSVAVKNPLKRIVTINKEEKNIFDKIKPAKETIRYDFEVYVRK
ncbi:MAG: hypothetical protein EBS06_02820 [Proteobacteria bacterium]|nr:hypothetical protein [Pseudomonadota bacterium]